MKKYVKNIHKTLFNWNFYLVKLASLCIFKVKSSFSAIFENLIEIRPEICHEAAEVGFSFQWTHIVLLKSDFFSFSPIQT